jgi:hypothetical protein
MRHKNMNSYFIQRAGGRLYVVANTDQHEYVGVVLKGVKPSVANPMVEKS